VDFPITIDDHNQAHLTLSGDSDEPLTAQIQRFCDEHMKSSPHCAEHLFPVLESHLVYLVDEGRLEFHEE
jgi:hypothetical protein